MDDRLNGWLAGWLIGLMVDRLNGWLGWWSIGTMVDRLDGWWAWWSIGAILRGWGVLISDGLTDRWTDRHLRFLIVESLLRLKNWVWKSSKKRKSLVLNLCLDAILCQEVIPISHPITNFQFLIKSTYRVQCLRCYEISSKSLARDQVSTNVTFYIVVENKIIQIPHKHKNYRFLQCSRLCRQEVRGYDANILMLFMLQSILSYNFSSKNNTYSVKVH